MSKSSSLLVITSSSSSSSISPLSSSSLNHESAMRRRRRTTFLLVSTLVFVLLYLHLHFLVDRNSSNDDDDARGGGDRDLPRPHDHHVILPRLPIAKDDHKYAIVEPEVNRSRGGGGGGGAPSSASEEAVAEADGVAAVSILFPDWEVFVVADPSSAGPGDELRCVFQNNATSPARFAGVLPSSNRTTFVCELPISVRRIRPFYQPLLTRSPIGQYAPVNPDRPPEELLRSTFLAYESLSTADDVALFVKGVNNRQGTNRPSSEFNCVFFVDGEDPSAGVRTAVTSSGQEVFRCALPELTPPAWGVGDEQTKRIKISLEIPREGKVLPTVAYYAPHSASPPRAAPPKALTCASTMVHNVAKFLREWVIYNSRIGVERFVLYDNGSEDGLTGTVEELNRDGYDVRTIWWPWPKTQEAGFSHSALYHNDSCTWMMYLDVDEFVYAPSWRGKDQPSGGLIKSSLLPRNPTVGQVSINCNEYGPSGQKSHPPDGVTQGYTCRRRFEQRHKSIVRLDALDPSLLNAIHHFTLAPGYRTKHMGLENAVVNHYKYQAWPEFQKKFRRRVSAYVVDWTKAVNLMSKDRTPGLGFEPIEPKDWANSFCEVPDVRLREIIQKWFGTRTGSGYRMPW